MDNPSPEEPKKNIQSLDLLLMGLTPTLVGKVLVLYFGHKYSANPGEGYGWLLTGSICLTLFTATRFLWKYRNWSE